VIYSSNIVDGESKAIDLASTLKTDFEKIVTKNVEAGKVNLCLCEVSADTEFTLYDQRSY
jgi:hypothetical protein